MVRHRPGPNASEATGGIAGLAARIGAALSSQPAPGRDKAAAAPAHTKFSPTNCIGTLRGPDGRERR